MSSPAEDVRRACAPRPDGAPRLALVALGTNLGDRLATLRSAAERLGHEPGFRLVARSGAFDTAPVGPPDQPRYLNAAVAIETALAPHEILARLLDVERAFGRVRGAQAARWGPRTLDLDLILLGECEIDDGRLELPHPRFRERAFVLLPLAEIAPSARDPVTGESVESLLRACPGRSDAVRIGSLEPHQAP